MTPAGGADSFTTNWVLPGASLNVPAMNSTLLIDAVVRQTTVLIAHLATASGGRTPLAHVANQVFLDLVNELKAQGLGHKVIADMFGLALRTYHGRIQRLAESNTVRGRSLWEAVLTSVQERGTTTRAELLREFHRDDEKSVRGVLRDLVEGGMLFASGRGDRTCYRAAEADVALQGASDPDEAAAAMVMVTLNQLGSSTAAELIEQLPMDPAQLERGIQRLVDSGRAVRDDAGRVSTESCVIPYGDTAGWEAAVLDHYQSVVQAIGNKISRGQPRAIPDDAIGGSTYHMEIYEGHPLQEEALGQLARVREAASELRRRVKEHPMPAGAKPLKVVFYLGQNVIGEEVNGDGHD